MGLFDGITGGTGSTADLATTIGLPIVLVVDAQGAGQSVGATVHGFYFASRKSRRADSRNYCQSVGSPRHLALLGEGLETAEVQVPFLGAISNDSRLQLPSRHLGLIPAAEQAALDSAIVRATELVAENCALEAIKALAATVPPSVSPSVPPSVPDTAPVSAPRKTLLHKTLYADTNSTTQQHYRKTPAMLRRFFRCRMPLGTDLGTSGLRKGLVCGSFMHLLTAFAPASLFREQESPFTSIAIAKDQAFAFIYPHFLDHWHSNGAQIHFFSPLADEAPVADADFIFLPGGYPELHAERPRQGKPL